MDTIKEKKIEEKLIRSSKKGNRKALEKLIRKYINFCYSMSLILLNDKKLAIISARNTLREVYLSISKLSEPNLFRIWLYKTLKENIFSIELQNSNLNQENYQINLKKESDNISSHLLLFDKIKSFPEEEKEILALVDFEGLDCQEVAEILNISVLEVRTKLYETKLKLEGF